MNTTIIYQNSHGHITIEHINRSEYYVVWLNNGCSAIRKATFGVTYPNALDRAKALLGETE